ncbi:MAG TPA: hypothetical protein VHZ95_05885 [Polyangiales bacterium]|nr:hypothetical protein [Polyangiales bacterium]
MVVALDRVIHEFFQGFAIVAVFEDLEPLLARLLFVLKLGHENDGSFASQIHALRFVDDAIAALRQEDGERVPFFVERVRLAERVRRFVGRRVEVARLLQFFERGAFVSRLRQILGGVCEMRSLLFRVGGELGAA